MKNTVYSCIIALFPLLGLWAQESELPEIIPPSPTVANLMAFEEVPVDTYTGQPNITVPLFSKSIGPNMTVGAVLRYHTSGVQIDNISGWAGTGWSLDIGGSISRTVRGTPDEEIHTDRLGALHNDGLWDYDNLSTTGTVSERERFLWNAVRGDFERVHDTQLDLYQFSLFGTSGRFVIVRDQNGNLEAKLLSRDQRINIELTQLGPNGGVNAFTLIDTFGYRYLFNVMEEQTSTPINGSTEQGREGVPQISANVNNVVQNVSAWHLSAVTNSNGENLLSISYRQKIHQYTNSFSRTTNELLVRPSSELLSNEYNNGIMLPRESFHRLNIEMISQKPAIVSFRDGTSMEFVPDPAIDHPESGGEILKQVLLKNADGSLNKKFELRYEIVPASSRLWLMELTETGGDISLDTRFSYVDKELLPGFSSPSDTWGYILGAPSNPAICGNGLVDYDPSLIATGLLSSIQYPTGGSKSFVFEENTFSYVGGAATTAEDHFLDRAQREVVSLRQPSIDIPGAADGTIVPPIPLPRGFILDSEQQVQIGSNINGQFADDSFKIVVTGANFNGSEHFAVVDLNDCESITLQPGNYQFGIKFFGLDTGARSAIDGTAEIHYTRHNGSNDRFLRGGGVRIAEIRFDDPDLDATAPQRRFQYDYTMPGDPLMSSGSVDGKLGSLSRDYTRNVTEYLFGTAANISGSFTPRTFLYRTRSKGPNVRMTKGGYVGYRSVKVEQEGNGYTRFQYTSPFDHPSPEASFRYPFPPAPNIEFKRGIMTSQRVYHQNGNILREVTNDPYDFSEGEIAPSMNVYPSATAPTARFYNAYSSYITKGITSNVPDCIGFAPCYDPTLDSALPPRAPFRAYQDPLTDSWARPTGTRTKEYFYDASGQQSLVERYQTFEYNEGNFRQSAVNTFIVEKGVTEHYRTETLYPIGHQGNLPSFFSTSMIQGLIALNMVDLPIYTKSLKDNVLLSESFSTYTESRADRMDLQRVTTRKEGGIMDDRVVYHRYDTYGNPLEVSRDGGPHTSYLWGFNGTYPLAKIDNATYAQVLATGVDLNVLNAVLNSNAAKKTELDKVRTGLPKALVSTYAYDPLVGVTDTTDPKNYSMGYQYDGLNRLEYVRDADGKLISENKYNYKDQN